MVGEHNLAILEKLLENEVAKRILEAYMKDSSETSLRALLESIAETTPEAKENDQAEKD